jgi:hypothetical protein
MSSGSLAGGIGVWGASLRPVGFGWQAGIMAAPELWALLLALWGWRRGWRLGTSLRPVGFGWQAGIMAAPELWALLLSLWGWRRVWRLGTPGLRPAGVPGGLRCCVGDFCSSLFGLAAGLASGDTRPSARGCPRWVALLRGGFPSLLPSFPPSFLRNR